MEYSKAKLDTGILALDRDEAQLCEIDENLTRKRPRPA
jgi:hypothetical protein